MVEFVNLKLINKIAAKAEAEGVDWRFERHQQGGKVLWGHVLLRNMTGDEQATRIYTFIDDKTNSISVGIWCNGADKFETLRQKITDQEGVAELTPAEYQTIGESGEGRKPRVYKIGQFKFFNSYSTDHMIDDVFEQIKIIAKVMTNIVY